MPVFLAGIFTGLTYPLYEWFLKKVKHTVVASLLALVSILLVLVLPLIAVGIAAYNEAVSFTAGFNLDAARNHLTSLLQNLQERFPGALEKLNVQNLSAMALNSVQDIFQFTLKHSAAISLSIADNLISFFLMLFIMFYFYIDGPKILKKMIRWSPLEDKYEIILIEKFISVSKGTLKGFLAVGIIQGIIGGLLFWIVGSHSPVFLGVLMVFGSLLPVVGTAIIWAPVAISLLIQGHWISAIWVVVVGGGVISSIDNLVRPMVVGKDIKMHDLMVLLSTLGGLGLFGLVGFIVGPIIAALFLAIWNIFEEIFSEELAMNEEARE